MTRYWRREIADLRNTVNRIGEREYETRTVEKRHYQMLIELAEAVGYEWKHAPETWKLVKKGGE